jgi:NAD+ synthase
MHADRAGAARLVLGLSGGIDSAVVCALAARAVGPERVIAAMLPIQSREKDMVDARLAAQSASVEPVLIDLGPAYAALIAAARVSYGEAHSEALDEEARERMNQLALANVKPRLRMTTLYFLANRANGLVVGTGNRTELNIGYFTKYGDGGVDLLPLADLDKTAVRALARELGVPEPIITKAPSAGLWEGQTDEAEIGVTYDELDRALAAIAAGEDATIDPLVRSRVVALVSGSEHKRAPIPTFVRSERGLNLNE